MSQKSLVEITKLTMMMEKQMQVRKKNIARYCQDFAIEELKDFDKEEKQRPKKK